jgi:hypothetical protein
VPSAPRATLNNPYGPEVTFRTEDVLPPSSLYLSLDDTPVFLFQTNTTNTYATIFLRVLMPDGTVRVDRYDAGPFQPLPAYNFLTCTPAECYLMSCNITGNLGSGGSLWCQGFVIRGTFNPPYSAAPPYGGMVIVQGYLDDFGFLSWPNSPVVEPGTGAGRMRAIYTPNVTGANFKFTVPSLTRWEIVSCQCVLHASAAGAARIMELVTFDPHGVSVCGYPSGTTTPPSGTLIYWFYQGAAEIQAEPTFITTPLPVGLTLDSGWSLQSNVITLDVGDQITNLALHVKEWVGIGSP